MEEPYGLTVLISCNPWANCGVSFGSSFQDVIALDPHEKRLAQGTRNKRHTGTTERNKRVGGGWVVRVKDRYDN